MKIEIYADGNFPKTEKVWIEFEEELNQVLLDHGITATLMRFFLDKESVE